MTIVVFFAILPVLVKCISEEVQVEEGVIRGNSFLSRNGTGYYGFLGVPFAKPPLGELRFEPPQPAEPWQGIKNATILPPACIQRLLLPGKAIISGQEDCLYLNVFAPKTSGSYPVIVFIHGGSYLQGSSSLYSPSYFMDYEVVVVTIQYRLNLLGFLSTGDHVLPGNYGMKDQVMALKWVQKNIAKFGGNPNKITLSGQSAGAGSVHYHMHSPLSTGLFHQGICQSGTSMAPWAHMSRDLAYQKALAVGTVVGCYSKDSKSLIKCFKKIPAIELVLAVDKLHIWESEPAVPFPIVMEPEDLDGAFITRNSWYNEIINGVPWIIGINSGDGAIQAIRYLQNDGKKVKAMNEDYKRLMPISLFYGSWIKDEDKVSRITESLKKYYFGDKNISSETPFELVRLFTDAYFTYDAIEAAKRSKNTVYFYYYDHRNERTLNEIFGQYAIDLGVSHADELLSLFFLNGLFPKLNKENDLKVSHRMVKYWVNFAYNGNPSTDKQVWEPVKSDDLEYLHIATDSDTMKKGLLKERYSLWKDLQVMPTFKQDSSKCADEL